MLLCATLFALRGLTPFGWPAQANVLALAQLDAVSRDQVRVAIDRLADLDFTVRMEAAATVRRAPAAIAVPSLRQAIDGHAEGWVRYKALVLLVGFNDPSVHDVMLRLLDDSNDRMRGIAYRYFEHHPEVSLLPRLLRALEDELSEFVRPSLIRALAARGSEPRVRDILMVDVDRGEDFFRSSVIEALGDYDAQYAVPALIRIAQQNGPLQDDAALALGKLGDRRALETLAALQRTAPREVQPAVAAAICLLGVNCATHLSYIAETARFVTQQPGFQPLLRSATMGLAAVGTSGNSEAVNILLDVGTPSRDPARAPMALGLGTIALRNPAVLLAVLAKRQDLDAAVLLLREAFDMLEEDFEEERFYATVRRTYWEAPEGSVTRTVAETLIGRLEF